MIGECTTLDCDGAVADAPWWSVKFTKAETGTALPEGFPYLIDELTGDICEVVLLFMVDAYLTRKLTFPRNTVAAYAHDLMDWMRAGAELNVPWDKATHADLARYVDSFDLVSPRTGRSARQSTVNRRLVPIRALYDWASQEYPHLVEQAPEGSLLKPMSVADFIDDRRKEMRYRPDFGSEPTEEVALPKVLQPGQLKAVLEAVGTAPSITIVEPDCGPSAQATVARLGAYIACQAGLRVAEVVGLKVRLFERFLNQEIVSARLYRIGPFRRKGGRSGYVDFHGVLLRAVITYIKRYRRYAMSGITSDHGFLLVHQWGQRQGRCVTESMLRRRFVNACLATGLTRTVNQCEAPRSDSTTKTTVTGVRAQFVFHDLRHTYAVWTYYARKEDGDPEPWKYIQEQLGHRHVSTTIQTYLKVSHTFEAEVSDKFVASLNAIAGLVEFGAEC